MKTNNSIQSDSRRVACVCALLLMAGGISSRAEEREHHVTAVQSPDARSTGNARLPQKLPPLPSGVSELKFNDFFVRPVGARGLELTETLRQLDGKRVRILGYMAQREGQPPGAFLLTPFPVQVHDHDNGLAEDFPASAVQVSVPTLPGQPVPYAPGLMLLTGTLSLGNRAEPDGRISLVRITLDPPGKAAANPLRSPARNAGKGAEALMRTSAGRP